MIFIGVFVIVYFHSIPISDMESGIERNMMFIDFLDIEIIMLLPVGSTFPSACPYIWNVTKGTREALMKGSGKFRQTDPLTRHRLDIDHQVDGIAVFGHGEVDFQPSLT